MGPDITLPELRAIARAKVISGRLPRAPHESRLEAGYGSGRPCAICGEPIAPQQVEYEVGVDGRAHKFHINCHGAWNAESATLASKPTPS